MHAISSQQLQTSPKFINLTEMLRGSFKISNLPSSSQNFFLGKKKSNIKIITKHHALHYYKYGIPRRYFDDRFLKNRRVKIKKTRSGKNFPKTVVEGLASTTVV